MSKDSAQYWIKTLGLVPHPGKETGYLCEVFRDPHQVSGVGHNQPRNAATNIYFLHQPAPPFGNDTVFFRMVNSEMLNFYRGHPVTLYIMRDPKKSDFETVTLGPDPDKNQCYFHVIPRNQWFTRRLESDNKDAFSLIGCTVVPGYHDTDIETETFGNLCQKLD